MIEAPDIILVEEQDDQCTGKSVQKRRQSIGDLQPPTPKRPRKDTCRANSGGASKRKGSITAFFGQADGPKENGLTVTPPRSSQATPEKPDTPDCEEKECPRAAVVSTLPTPPEGSPVLAAVVVSSPSTTTADSPNSSLQSRGNQAAASPRLKVQNASTQRKKTPKTSHPPHSLADKAKRDELRQEKERLKEERERVREEKARHKEEAKLQREKERLEKEQEKLRREKEKEEERERREKERAEKKQREEEEKRARQEEKLRKQQEAQTKQEEKRKREEEKRQKEEEEKAKQLEKRRKAEEQFRSFFKAKTTVPVEERPVEVSRFKPFPIRPGVTLAPCLERAALKDTSVLDKALSGAVNHKTLYLDEIRQRCPRHFKASKAEGVLGSSMNEIEVVCVIDKSTGEVLHSKATSADDPAPTRYQVKLLQFAENHRPPYYGTWQKRSKHIRARQPFAKDESFLDYEVDSDDEWEEEEPGESISNSEGEDADGEDEEEDGDDGFFVPHGYLSDDEGGVEVDCDAEMVDDFGMESKDLRRQRLVDKAKAWEASHGKGSRKELQTILIGCLSENINSMVATQWQEVLKSFLPCLLVDEPVEPFAPPGPAVSSAESSSAALTVEESKSRNSGTGSTPRGLPCMAVPDEAMLDLVKHVHNSRRGVSRLVDDFRELWAQKRSESRSSGDSVSTGDTVKEGGQRNQDDHAHPSGISKRQLEMKIHQIASKVAGQWAVKPEVILQVGLSEDELKSKPPISVVSSPSSSVATGSRIRQFFTQARSKPTGSGSPTAVEKS